VNESAARVRRAVILAAGQSRRLESLRLDLPKPAIEIDGRPLLVRHIEQCAAHGIEEIYINLHYHPEKIRALAGDGSRWGVRIFYHLEPALLGTAGGVKGFAGHLRAGPFLVIYGDNYGTFSLAEIIEAHFGAPDRPDMSILLHHREDVSSSGVAVCDARGRITSFIEKPAPGTTDSHWVNAGVYLLEPHLLDTIPAGASDFGHELIPAWLAAGRMVLGVKTRGQVYPVDTPELLQQLLAKTAAKPPIDP
jgi:NDP-sugar pyrophosphorylase family protein